MYPNLQPLLITDIAIDVLFMIDIVINFRTTYVKESETLVTCPIKIAKHYLKTYFVVDFVAAIPWELIVGEQAEEVGSCTWYCTCYCSFCQASRSLLH